MSSPRLGFPLIFIVSAALTSIAHSQGFSAQPQRGLQASFLPAFAHFAQDLNGRLYRGAVATQNVMNRLDETEASNPDGVIAKARDTLARTVNSESREQSTSDGVGGSASSARDQLLGMMKKQTERSSETSSQPEGSSESLSQPKAGSVSFNDVVAGEHGERVVTQINLRPGKRAKSLVGAALGGLLNAVAQSPGDSAPDRVSPEGGRTDFQERMVRLAETLGLQEAASVEPSEKPKIVSVDSFSLGPLSPKLQSDVEKEEPLDSSNDDSCWQDGFALEGDEFRVKGNLEDSLACRNYCLSSRDCTFFSFTMAPKSCYMFDEPTSIKASKEFVSGPASCSLLSNDSAVPSFWPRAPSRQLQELALSASDSYPDESSTNCLAVNTGIEGNEFNRLERVDTPAACQTICLALGQCEFFSHAGDSQRCYLYDSASGVTTAQRVTSGPRTCLGSAGTRGEPYTPFVDSDGSSTAQEESRTGRIIASGQQQTQDAGSQDNEPSSLKSQQEESSSISGQESFAPARQEGILGGALGLLGGGLLGSVLGGGLFAGHGGLLTGRMNEKELEGAGVNAMSMLSTVQALMAAGDTVTKVFPIGDMVRAGYQLANSGLLDGAGGRGRGGGRGNSATGPPTGVGNPEVTCLTEGMRCCVPRTAAPRYQVDPPKLNGVDSPRCISTYVSQWDQLCATTKYDDDECGTFILETTDMFVYRNIVEMPGKNMNNAICECSIQKKGGDIQSSGKWEYSLVAKEEDEATRQRSEEAMAKLTNAAKVAMTWGDALSTRNGQTGAAGGGSASSFLNSLVSIAEDIGGQGTTNNAPGGRQSVDSDSLTLAASNLLEALSQMRSNSQTRRLLQEMNTEREVNSTVPVPFSCSVWRRDCETNLERLVFDQTCHATKIVQNGCPRKDVDVELETIDGPNGVTFRFRLPSVFGLDPLGIACDFVFIPFSADSTPSFCVEGKFPIPDHTLPDNWPQIRERGPLLELVLTMAPDTAVASLLESAVRTIQTPVFAASDADLYEKKLSNTRGATEYEVIQRRLSVPEGVTIFLSFDPTVLAQEGDAMSALFNVDRALDNSARWGREAKITSRESKKILF